ETNAEERDGRVVRIGGHRGDGSGREDADAGRDSILAVNEVEGVGEEDDPEDGRGQRQRPEGDGAAYREGNRGQAVAGEVHGDGANHLAGQLLIRPDGTPFVDQSGGKNEGDGAKKAEEVAPLGREVLGGLVGQS